MQITAPVPVEQIGIVGEILHWLKQRPEANYDDSMFGICDGPLTLDMVNYRFEIGRKVGELSWLISNDQGAPAGIVCFQREYPWKGRLHGVCFGRGLMPPERKRDALKVIIADIFKLGVDKISAQYFAHNKHIARFLADLGFTEEGYLKGETRQHGEAVDVVQVARFKA